MYPLGVYDYYNVVLYNAFVKVLLYSAKFLRAVNFKDFAVSLKT